jgi:hypothetical protein
MCWNPDVSITTFLFSCFTLIFIYVTTTLTKYKHPFFKNKFMYLFVFLVACMQLVEFFLWRNLNNRYNEFFSRIGSFVLLCQQVCLMLMIPNPFTRHIMFLLYGVLLVCYWVYQRLHSPIYFHTSIGKNGHLSWEWINYNGYEQVFLIVGLLFYIIPALLISNPTLSLFMFPYLAVSLYYYKDKTFGTMWCWGSNFFLLYFILDILVLHPLCF